MHRIYPLWFYIPAAVLFVGLLRRADVRVVLLLASPAGRSSTSSSSASTTSCSSSANHSSCRASSTRSSTGSSPRRSRSCSGSRSPLLLTSQIIASRLPAVGRLLPGAGVDDRRRHHLQGAARPVRRRRQRRARVDRHRRARVVHRPATSPCSRSRSSTSGRASASRRSSSSRASSRSRTSTSRPPRSTARARGRASGTSRCRCVRPATATVIILSLIGGLRSFDLIWATTEGGPGFTSDVIASVIYKQYQAGLLRPVDRRQRRALPGRDGDHGAGLVPAQPTGGGSMKRGRVRAVVVGVIAIVASVVVFIVPFAFIFLTASKTSPEASRLEFTLAAGVGALGERRRGARPTRRHGRCARS